jgi:hypothetical protein
LYILFTCINGAQPPTTLTSSASASADAAVVIGAAGDGQRASTPTHRALQSAGEWGEPCGDDGF